jgi:hypothetical protein
MTSAIATAMAFVMAFVSLHKFITSQSRIKLLNGQQGRAV